jgi:hypothetical protein
MFCLISSEAYLLSGRKKVLKQPDKTYVTFPKPALTFSAALTMP